MINLYIKYRALSLSMKCKEFVLIFPTFPNGGKKNKIIRVEPCRTDITDLKYLLKFAENMK